jgi:hypothetical protein
MPTIRDLRREIDRYINLQPRRKGRGPLVMDDVADSAEACQRRIEAMGYQWDSERMLWRAPIQRNEE